MLFALRGDICGRSWGYLFLGVGRFTVAAFWGLPFFALSNFQLESLSSLYFNLLLLILDQWLHEKLDTCPLFTVIRGLFLFFNLRCKEPFVICHPGR